MNEESQNGNRGAKMGTRGAKMGTRGAKMEIRGATTGTSRIGAREHGTSGFHCGYVHTTSLFLHPDVKAENLGERQL
jgi:hypothetical protein